MVGRVIVNSAAIRSGCDSSESVEERARVQVISYKEYQVTLLANVQARGAEVKACVKESFESLLSGQHLSFDSTLADGWVNRNSATERDRETE